MRVLFIRLREKGEGGWVPRGGSLLSHDRRQLLGDFGFRNETCRRGNRRILATGGQYTHGGGATATTR